MAEALDPDQNLYKRGATYYVRYELGGQERRHSLGTPDVKKARRERDRILAEVGDLRAGRAPEIVRTWQEACEGYLGMAEAHVRSGKLSQDTADRYAGSLVQLTLAFSGDPDEHGRTQPTPLSAITKGTLVDFVEARREQDRASSTILNDLTACSRVLAYGCGRDWLEHNVARTFDRRMFIGTNATDLDQPTDEQVAELVAEVSTWKPDMGLLVTFLRETGTRLSEALLLRAEDVHPDGRTATLSRGVKRGKVRTIDLGRAAELLEGMPKQGRLFPGLHPDSAVVSTRHGQWHRQRQERERKAAEAEGRPPVELFRCRLHDERHAFAIASLIDDSGCVYRLMEHLGHSSVKTTEGYVRYLRGEGAMRKFTRRVDLFGSLMSAQAPAHPAQREAAE